MFLWYLPHVTRRNTKNNSNNNNSNNNLWVSTFIWRCGWPFFVLYKVITFATNGPTEFRVEKNVPLFFPMLGRIASFFSKKSCFFSFVRGLGLFQRHIVFNIYSELFLLNECFHFCCWDWWPHEGSPCLAHLFQTFPIMEIEGYTPPQCQSFQELLRGY